MFGFGKRNNTPQVKPMKQQAKTFHEQLERLNPLLGIVLSVALGIKSSYMWSFGKLDITKLSAPWPDLLNISSAIAIAITAETLSINSGSHAWRSLQRSIDIGTERGINKTQRAAMKAKLRTETVLHGSFALVGAGASTAAMVYFALNHGANGNQIGDLVTAIMVQILVLYIGVFFEPSAPNPFAIINAEASRGLAAIMSQYADNIRQGTYDNNQIIMMQKAMPKEMRGMLDGLMKQDGTVKVWNTTDIVGFLLARLSPTQRDLMYATTMRDVRNWINNAKDDAFYQIREADKGGGKVIPGDKMFILFEEPIRRAVQGEPAFPHGRKRPSRQVASVNTRNNQPTEKENAPDVPENASNGTENLQETAVLPVTA